MGLRVRTQRDGVAGFIQLNDDGSWKSSPENADLFGEHPLRTGDENGNRVDWTDGEVWIENLWKVGNKITFGCSKAEQVEE